MLPLNELELFGRLDRICRSEVILTSNTSSISITKICSSTRRPDRVMGMHFGTFDLSDEPLAEPPRRFRDAARTGGYAESDAWILRIGETRPF